MKHTQHRTRPVFWLISIGIIGDLCSPLFPNATFMGTPLLFGLLLGIIFITALNLLRLKKAAKHSRNAGKSMESSLTNANSD